MLWVYVVAALFACLAVVEWTSRPPRRGTDSSEDVAEVRIPQPRTPAPGWTMSDGRPQRD